MSGNAFATKVLVFHTALEIQNRMKLRR